MIEQKKNRKFLKEFKFIIKAVTRSFKDGSEKTFKALIRVELNKFIELAKDGEMEAKLPIVWQYFDKLFLLDLDQAYADTGALHYDEKDVKI